MKILNNNGPSIDPCGIAAATIFVVLVLLLITTLYDFLDNCTSELVHNLRNCIL